MPTINPSCVVADLDYTQRGQLLDRNDGAAPPCSPASVTNTPPRPSRQAILREDLLALETLDGSMLRDLRDRAMLLLGSAGGCAAPKSSALMLREDGRG
ncbi:hypothetical protein FJ872_03095 [Mesorhizobium sp. B2-5-9]|nr:hypothetical protein FJ872_02460 [Mesorhizobium sp. B2-5-9]TPK24035.1 hypothetical protein FJ872_03095 [Mesorhizobium sp. B2-5-9]